MIEKVASPQDLKKLEISDLAILAEEVRQEIINVVSLRGGHLASSLGAVEICIALQYCLNTPTDKIVFDVGHQTYAHKIITGRKEQFQFLRQYTGISGFPNPQESEYDTFISGHASTAVSWAQGIAEAIKRNGGTARSVAVIGDGSLTGGMCFEALNHCGHTQADVLVLLNHNEMSISSSVGALSNYLTKIISLPIYNRIRKELDHFLQHLPGFALKLVHKAGKFEEAIKGLIVPGIFFEELGFRYFGPIDGHDITGLIPTLQNVLSLPGPKLLHVITKKGKGYSFAEENAEDFHSAAPFDVRQGRRIGKTKETFSSVFAHKLLEMAILDDRIVAITAAMIKGTGLSSFHERFPGRVFDVGIAEEHAIGLASGLAREGLRPFVAIYSTFLQRGFDQIIHDVALQKLPVTFCIDRGGFVGEDGPTHHGVFDIAYLRIIPNLICMAPKDKDELEDMLEFTLTQQSPCSMRYPKGESYSLGKRDKVILGKAQVLTEGDDICIIAIGAMVREAWDATKLLQQKGIDVCLVNARFIKPMDESLFLSLAKQHRFIVTVEEGVLAGGFGSAVIELFERENLLGKVCVKRFGVRDEFSPCASREKLLEKYSLDSKSMAERIQNFFEEELLGGVSVGGKRGRQE